MWYDLYRSLGVKGLNIKCVFSLFLQLLFETSLIPRRIQRNIIKNVEVKVKVNQSRYRPGVAQRVPGS